MAKILNVNRAISEGRKTLASFGYECIISEADFENWFRADTPYPDVGIEDVIKNPLLVIHEIVEIHEVKKMGLDLGRKDAILSNLNLVDKAHLRAAQIEMEIAFALRNRAHLMDRLRDIEKWCMDELVEPDMKAEYSKLRGRVEEMLASLNENDGEIGV